MNQASRSRRTTWVLLAIVALGLGLRLAAWTGTTGLHWDTSSHYLPMAVGLEDALAGRAHCQMGARRPELTHVGYAVAVRAVMALGFEYRSAGQLLSLGCGVGLLGLVFLLGRRLGGDAVGLGAAALLALDGRFVSASVMVQTEMLFLFGVVGLVLLLLLPERLRARHTAAAGLLLGLLCTVRGVGLTVAPLVPALTWWRWRAGDATRRALLASVLVTGITVACASWLGGYVERVNQAPAISNQLRLTLFFLGEFDDAYWPDESGEVLRIVSTETDYAGRLTPAVMRTIAWARVTSLAEHVLPLLALAVAGVVALGQGARTAGVTALAAGLAPILAPILVLAPATTSRYYLPLAPFLYPLACVALAAAISWLGRRRRRGAEAGDRGETPGPRGWPVPAACLVAGLLLWPPSSTLWQVRRHLRDRSWRAQGDRNAVALARFLSPATVVGRGPGGLTEHLGLVGCYARQVAGGPDGPAIARYVRANELQWMLYAPEFGPSLGQLPGLRVVPVLEFSVRDQPQVLARVEAVS